MLRTVAWVLVVAVVLALAIWAAVVLFEVRMT
jgi:hypothetical protein